MFPRFSHPWLERTLALSLIILGTPRVVPVLSTQDSGEAAPAASSGVGSKGAPLKAQEPIPPHESGVTVELSRKQKQNLLKSNFEKMKRDADELSELAKSLQEDLSKTSENVLSLEIVEKAEKIEMLAKKIKGAAKGF